MRDIIFLIILIVLVAVAAFEGGYIVRDLRGDQTGEQIKTLFSRQYDLSGRVTVLEGPKKIKMRDERRKTIDERSGP